MSKSWPTHLHQFTINQTKYCSAIICVISIPTGLKSYTGWSLATLWLFISLQILIKNHIYTCCNTVQCLFLHFATLTGLSVHMKYRPWHNSKYWYVMHSNKMYWSCLPYPSIYVQHCISDPIYICQYGVRTHSITGCVMSFPRHKG